MPTLVLWDIDRTLLDLRRLGGAWFLQALREVTGRSAAALPPTAGRTDRWIARQLLVGAGVEPAPARIDELHAAAIRIAAADRDRIADVGVVLPGAADALRALAGHGDVVQTLVTGNVRPIAGYKVGAFGLDKYLDLEIGGYGDTSEIRAGMVADALAGARQRHGAPFTGHTVVVVGDTPHDVEGALAHDIRAVGVATGKFTTDELAASGAHAVLPDLADTDRALAAILG